MLNDAIFNIIITVAQKNRPNNCSRLHHFQGFQDLQILKWKTVCFLFDKKKEIRLSQKKKIRRHEFFVLLILSAQVHFRFIRRNEARFDVLVFSFYVLFEQHEILERKKNHYQNYALISIRFVCDCAQV